jgi:aspartate kinase
MRIRVIKIGGSVLTGPDAFGRAAAFLCGVLAETPDRKLAVVVSAESGTTDALLAAARDLVADPDPATLDLLWSTGELRSVALVTLALHRRGVQAIALNVHQVGLVESGAAAGFLVRPLRLRAALASHDIVVVPGFLARSAGDALVSLGRGGSDLTAVILADGLKAEACELVKDVPGYFSADPNRDPDARPLETVTYDAALAMATAGCGLVQRAALEAARESGVPLAVRGIGGGRTRLARA